MIRTSNIAMRGAVNKILLSSKAKAATSTNSSKIVRSSSSYSVPSLPYRSLSSSSRSLSYSVSSSSSLSSSLLSPPSFSTSSAPSRSFSSSPSTAATPSWQNDSPYHGPSHVTYAVPPMSSAVADQVIAHSAAAFDGWKKTSLVERQALVARWCEIASSDEEVTAIAEVITTMMGKPLSQSRGEAGTAVARARVLSLLAPAELAESIVGDGSAGDGITISPNPNGILRKITKEPIGPVLTLVPWNYPLLCTVNSLIAAVLSGCSVVIKHSDRTPLVAEWFARTFLLAGAPEGLVSVLRVTHAELPRIIANPSVAYVQFTGSVAGGRAITRAIGDSGRFIDAGLELGGKDAAYVAQDANLDFAVENIVDGGMYNAGQSCCAIERVYVHKSLYAKFVLGAQKAIEGYTLGDPMDSKTNMGPIAQPGHPAFLEKQVQDAVGKGARIVVGGKPTNDAAGKGRFFQPTLIAECTHDMHVMTEESFGPILAVMSVSSDAEAIKLMNDSAYGLTGSIWTSSIDRASSIAAELDVGTVFMNRCDNPDPALAWSGRKDSGKGVGLSKFGFAQYSRTKSYNFRTNTK